MRPWRLRSGNARVWTVRFGSRLTFRAVGGLWEGVEAGASRPVLRVSLRSRDGGTLVSLRYRAALPPVFLRVMSLGLLGLVIRPEDDDRVWTRVQRSLEQSVAPALLDPS
jgi:hypothetical protein